MCQLLHSGNRKVEVLVLGIFSSGAYVFSRVCDRGFLVGAQDLANRIMLKLKLISTTSNPWQPRKDSKKEREKRTQFLPVFFGPSFINIEHF
jgi:hypothetical protein